MRLGMARVNGADTAIVEVGDASAVTLQALGLPYETVDDLIAAGAVGLAKLSQALAAERAQPGATRLQIADLDWRAPVSRPKNMFCVALNNTVADPTLLYRPAHPAYFTKPTSSLIGCGQEIEIFPHYGLTHCEPELAVVIGRTARNVPVETAMEHVFGYSIVNDITSVGMRKEDRFHGGYPTRAADGQMQFVEEVLTYPARYKGADTFGPMGPWLTTPDEFPNPGDVRIRCWLDDEEIFDDRTSNLHFSIAQAIAWISAHSTLHQGDILSMGTAGHPDQMNKPLSHGDIAKRGSKVRVAIDGLGVLENPVSRKTGADPRQAFPPVTGLGSLLKAHGLTKNQA